MADVEISPTILAADPQYPLKIDYCAECSLPYEYCEYGPHFEKCKESLKKNLPALFSQLYLGGVLDNDDDQNPDLQAQSDDKKRQKRGGKSCSSSKTSASKKTGQEQRKICLSRAPRGKNKFVTVVTGLASYGECKV
uniref:DENR N-terminal domain-containing protein n=1 Tax=Romanomermis culicivorax TaxID=13658 RepID=A0A915JLQ4_ROMCU